MDKLIEKAKIDKSFCVQLKEMAIQSKDFELANKLREIESNFIKTDEQKEAEQLGDSIRILFAMADYNLTNQNAWFIYNVCQTYKSKKGKTDLQSIIKLKFKALELFK